MNIPDEIYSIFKSKQKYNYSHIKIRYGEINDPVTWKTINLPFSMSSIEQLCQVKNQPYEYEINGEIIEAREIRKVSFRDNYNDLITITNIPDYFLNHCVNLIDVDLTGLKYVRYIGKEFLSGCENLKVVRMGFINASFLDEENSLDQPAIFLTNDLNFNNFGLMNEEYKQLPKLQAPTEPNITQNNNQIIFNFIEDDLFTHYTLNYYDNEDENIKTIEIFENEYILNINDNISYIEYFVNGNIGIYLSLPTQKRKITFI